MIRMILTLLLIYIVYKFVFEFLIPLFNTTRHMSNKVKEMTEKMQEQERKKQMEEQNHTAHSNAPKPAPGDYIEYEEIK
ncbi:MAG TPA: hypothetical protein PKC62_04390 [Ferruginibacter sp.]|jgi:Na+-transporting methylmalonyl-CoA/oxaloacetate decarboxylase gamma subunit|nr:ATP synthase subunit I [Bacteroidota bacterium]MBS1925943.1 ATP synthase subunit I [Bacteroidota bacterium]HMT95906.1 hypothetical protein [Ferruginibacter sp.]HMU25049.1 hypothetical protein [Ferruginibacter sp.]